MVLMSREPLCLLEKNGMIVRSGGGLRESMNHARLRRSGTEGAPAERRELLRISRLSAGAPNESIYLQALLKQ